MDNLEPIQTELSVSELVFQNMKNFLTFQLMIGNIVSIKESVKKFLMIFQSQKEKQSGTLYL